MLRYPSQKQLALAKFEWPLQTALDKNNQWVKLSQFIPWDELADQKPTQDDYFLTAEKKFIELTKFLRGEQTFKRKK